MATLIKRNSFGITLLRPWPEILAARECRLEKKKKLQALWKRGKEEAREQTSFTNWIDTQQDILEKTLNEVNKTIEPALLPTSNLDKLTMPESPTQLWNATYPDCTLSHRYLVDTLVNQLGENVERSALVLPGPVLWGGQTGNVFFTNTCPIDNFLLLFAMALENIPDIRPLFSENDHPVANAVLRAADHVNCRDDAKAKSVWAELLDLRPNERCVIDFYGSEYHRFLKPYGSAFLRSVVLFSCSTCPYEQELACSDSSLGPLLCDTEPEYHFEEMVMEWLAMQRECRQCHEPGRAVRTFAAVPPLLLFDLPPELVAEYNVKDLMCLPSVLLISKEHFQNWQGFDDVNNVGVYMLMGATFAGPGHFKGAFLATADNSKFCHGWYSFDGKCGHVFCGAKPPRTPDGYIMSTVSYCFLPGAYGLCAYDFVQWLDQ